VLASAGYDPSRHRARQFGPDWFDCDLILVMDRQNLADVREVLPAQRHDRVRLFRSFDPTVDGVDAVPDVPDPWYGGADGFAAVLAIIERTSAALVDQLKSGQYGYGGSL
jgi:protein-tyrosine phosphatase